MQSAAATRLIQFHIFIYFPQTSQYCIVNRKDVCWSLEDFRVRLKDKVLGASKNKTRRL